MLAFGQTADQNLPDTTNNMFIKADTTLIVQQELNLSKLETKDQKVKEKRNKWLGTLVQILRDIVADKQINHQ